MLKLDQYKQLHCLKIFRGMWILILLSLLLSGIGILEAQGNTQVYIEVPTQTANIGSTLPSVINVETVEHIYGVEVHLHFDPNQIQIEDANNEIPGTQVSLGEFFDEKQGFAIVNSVNNTTGEIVYAFTLLSPAEPISGNGPLINLDLEVIGEGESDLLLTDVILATNSGTSIPVETQNAKIYGIHNQANPATSHSPSTTVVPSIQSSPLFESENDSINEDASQMEDINQVVATNPTEEEQETITTVPILTIPAQSITSEEIYTVTETENSTSSLNPSPTLGTQSDLPTEVKDLQENVGVLPTVGENVVPDINPTSHESEFSPKMDPTLLLLVTIFILVLLTLISVYLLWSIIKRRSIR